MCQLTFFSKMATLIAGTIVFSLIYSLLFFMPLLALLGPSGELAPLTETLRRLHRRLAHRAHSTSASVISPLQFTGLVD